MANARKFVVKLLGKIEDGSAYSNILLDTSLKRSELTPQDKKFAAALFYGTLERKLTLDEIIKSYLKNPADKLGSETKNILRIGMYQLLYMDSVPDSAAVDECVKLAKKNRNPSVAGFVNGVLRTFLRDDKPLPTGKTKAESLSLEFSCPLWLVEKWLNEYGEKVTLSMLETSLGQAPVTVKANTLKMPIDDIILAFKEDEIPCEKISFVKDGLRIFASGSIENVEVFRKGLCHVQDLSSQLCCMALDVHEGDTVVDLCSAPGGKAFTIAQLMNDNGSLHAFDLHENRVRLIRAGAYRLGIKCITATENNAKIYNENIPQADRVLCDVPCSGLGVIRRKPEIKYKNPADFERLPQVQYDILDTASQYVKVGGVLVYSTCTLSKAENDDVVDKFLNTHSDFEPCTLAENVCEEFNGTRVTITPDIFGSDGFFIAKFRRLR